MKIIQEIAGRIWALWGMLSFIATFLLFYIPSMLTWLVPEPKGQALFIGIARLWMNIWLRLVGCPVKVAGREHFKKGVSYIVTCNHNSLMDVPLSSPFIPGANKTIAKTSFVKIPLFGFYYMKGSVLVNRNSESSRRESYEKMKRVLDKGMHMCIYPEGTRNRTAEPLKKFHDGAFRLAAETGHAIIPAVIFHTKKALPIHKPFFFWPQKLAIHFLPPVEINNQTADQLKEKVFAIMKDHYTSHLT
jgi:1-acyl-sn-glycerol-3-phosphate acyltransferase